MNQWFGYAHLLETGSILSLSASILSSTMTVNELWERYMHIVGLQEAAGQLAELIDEVASGEEVVIAREDT